MQFGTGDEFFIENQPLQAEVDQVKQNIYDYDRDAIGTKHTKFFTTADPRVVFLMLNEKLSGICKSVEKSDTKMKLTYKAVETQYVLDEKSESTENDIVLERIQGSAKLYKCPDGKTCIDFAREGGSCMFFFTHFELIRKSMEDIIDATEDKVVSLSSKVDPSVEATEAMKKVAI